MHIAWGSLGIVFMVSFAASVAVVTLVSFALVALSGRSIDSPGAGTSVALPATAANKAIAGVCLAAAGLIVLYGLYVIVAA
ncbi:MAG TPA: hypothetical protein VJ890_04170 [Vineibacter sp.]|nr:hypothetical protein [Vineibacter sp.]